MPPIYLDHHATTPCDPRVVEAMLPYFTTHFGNASSRTHAHGWRALEAVEAARAHVAALVGAADPRKIVFTSGSTESINIALQGFVAAAAATQRDTKDTRDTKDRVDGIHGVDRIDQTDRIDEADKIDDGFLANSPDSQFLIPRPIPHLITLATEHSAVLETARALHRRGAARLTILPVQPDGLLHPPLLSETLTAIVAETNAPAAPQRGAGILPAFPKHQNPTQPDPAPQFLTPNSSSLIPILLTIHAVNNELGVIQPLDEIVRTVRAVAPHAVIHVDAAQAPGRMALDVARLGIDLLSLSAHKFYGPKGIGALVFGTPAGRRAIAPVTFGGGHERGLRPGTLNVPAIVGFGEAARIARAELDADTARIAALRDELWARLRAALPTARLNGSATARVAANLNICFPGCPGAQLVAALRGLSVSTGSACSAATAPSHVLRAIGLTPTDADSSLRISLGRFTSKEEIAQAAEQIIAAVREHTMEDFTCDERV